MGNERVGEEKLMLGGPERATETNMRRRRAERRFVVAEWAFDVRYSGAQQDEETNGYHRFAHSYEMIFRTDPVCQ